MTNPGRTAQDRPAEGLVFGSLLAGIVGAIALAASPALGWYEPGPAANRFGEQTGLSGWQAFSIEDVLLTGFALWAGLLFALALMRLAPSRRALIAAAAGGVGVMAAIVAFSRILVVPVDDFSVVGGAWMALAAALLIVSSALVAIRQTAAAQAESAGTAPREAQTRRSDKSGVADPAEKGSRTGGRPESEFIPAPEEPDPPAAEKPTLHPRLRARVERSAREADPVASGRDEERSGRDA